MQTEPLPASFILSRVLIVTLAMAFAIRKKWIEIVATVANVQHVVHQVTVVRLAVRQVDFAGIDDQQWRLIVI